MPIPSSDHDKKLTEYFLSEVAGFLKNIEGLYRELKLKKKVWEKITPVILQYMVGRSFLHGLEDIYISDATIEEESLNLQFSTEEHNNCANDVNACLTELSSLNAKHFEIYPQVCASFQVVFQKLQNKSSKQILKRLARQYFCNSSEANVANLCHSPKQFKDTVLKDEYVESVESTTLQVDNHSVNPLLSQSEKVNPTITSFTDSLCVQNDATVEQVDTLLEFFETYTVVLMANNV